MVFMTAVCKQHHPDDILNMSVSASQMFSRDGHVTLKASIGFRDYPSNSVSSLHRVRRVRRVLCIILYQADSEVTLCHSQSLSFQK